MSRCTSCRYGCGNPLPDCCFAKRSGIADSAGSSPIEAESDSVDKLVEADLASLFESSVDVETIPFELVDRSEVIRLQQSDLGLSSLF